MRSIGPNDPGRRELGWNQYQRLEWVAGGGIYYSYLRIMSNRAFWWTIGDDANLDHAWYREQWSSGEGIARIPIGQNPTPSASAA